MSDQKFGVAIVCDVPSKKAVLWIAAASVALCATVFLGAAIALADVSIGGQDASAQMKDVQTLITTIQTIGFKWVAPLIGGGLAIMGILQIATRRVATGLLALGSGGALFAVEKIATSLSHIAGN